MAATLEEFSVHLYQSHWVRICFESNIALNKPTPAIGNSIKGSRKDWVQFNKSDPKGYPSHVLYIWYMEKKNRETKNTTYDY